MKKLLFLLLIFASCEKDVNQTDCKTCYSEIVRSDYRNGELKSRTIREEGGALICNGEYRLIRWRTETDTIEVGPTTIIEVKTIRCR